MIYEKTSKTGMLKEAMAFLKANFPVWKEKMPLAIGAFEEVRMVVLDPHIARQVLAKHTTHPTYLYKLGNSVIRFHLDGAAADLISMEHKVHADERRAEKEAIIKVIQDKQKLRKVEKNAKKALQAKKLAKQNAKKNKAANKHHKPPQPLFLNPIVLTSHIPKPTVAVVVKKRRTFTPN